MTEPARMTVDECIEYNDSVNHPTTVVMGCSPDPVLTRDGHTSQACRRCHCGRHGGHVELCNRPEAIAKREEAARIQAAVDARPLDVYDIAGMRPKYQHARMSDHWYWCRRHQRAEHSGWAMDACVRVGPFMTEREANRLSNVDALVPLGMEVER